MVEITARHMVGGQLHEHIAKVKYISSDGKVEEATRQQMVDWLSKRVTPANVAIVYSRDRKSYAYVGVVRREPNARDYIRTYADRKWTDNLLALPEYN
jgi:hypothetical protein